MPTITRWFNVSHDINADPEMWELRETFGDRAGFIWLECLAIADRNSGVIGPDSDHTRNHLASKCRTNRAKVKSIIAWCMRRGWIAVGLPSDRHRIAVGFEPDMNPTPTRYESDTSPTPTQSILSNYLRVAKWAKYNKTRDAKKPPSLPSEPSEPTKPSLKSVKKQTLTADFLLPDWLPKVEWEEFIEHRKHKKAPLTEFTAKRIIAVLRELMDLGHSPAEVLAEAIDRNWTGIKTEWIHKAGGFYERQKEGELSEHTKRILRRGL
jgi:hypothetical protein